MPDSNLRAFQNLMTERLVLRKLKKEDADDIKLLRSDCQVNEFIDRPKSVTLEEASDFIEYITHGIDDKECFYWAITQQNIDKVIGAICLWNFSAEKKMAEIGYELHPLFHGKGIMQEALARVIDFGFTNMQLQVITALSIDKNIKSIRLLVRNGFQPDVHYEFVSKEEANGLSVYYLPLKK